MIHRFQSISQFHRFRNMPQPEHPLISIIDLASIPHPEMKEAETLVLDFYAIALKRDFTAKVKYGQQSYDFDSGLLGFQAPGQVMRIEPPDKPLQQSGWMLLFHPDFLWHTSLAAKIKQYDFFDYAVHEALFLSEKEEATITGIFHNIEQEYHQPIDRFSQEIVIVQIEALLAYSDRFYQRQFINRKITNHQVLARLDDLLNTWINGDRIRQGLPTVTALASQLNVSPHYLSAILRSLTGLNAQQHIHEKLINKAKTLLSTTELSVSEIAYALGFEHMASFSKLFKHKTNLSPVAFRKSFN